MPEVHRDAAPNSALLLGITLPPDLLGSAPDATFDSGLLLPGESFHLSHVFFRRCVTECDVGKS